MSFAPLKRAFSLIELLVSVSIMLLLFSGALAAYTRYTEKQRIVAAAEAIESAIKDVQNRAKTGYLADCSELQSHNFRLWMDAGNLTYQLSSSCSDSLDNTSETSVILGEDFTLNSAFQLRFQPYSATLIEAIPSSGNVDQLTSLLSSSRRTDYVVTLTFDRGGGIKVKY